MRKQLEIYQSLFKLLMGILVTLLIGAFLLSFYLGMGRKIFRHGETWGIMGNPEGIAIVESRLQKLLATAYVLREPLDDWRASQEFSADSDFVYEEAFPAHNLLLKEEGRPIPLEAALSIGQRRIPYFAAETLRAEEREGWSYVERRPQVVTVLDARTMQSQTSSAFCKDGPEGKIFRQQEGKISKTLDLPSGVVEFEITACSQPMGEAGGGFDPRTQMEVGLDGNILGKANVEPGEFRPYRFKTHVNAGTHILSITFLPRETKTPGTEEELAVKEVSFYIGQGVIVYKHPSPTGFLTKTPGAYLSYVRNPNFKADIDLLRLYKELLKEDLVSFLLQPRLAVVDVKVGDENRKGIFAPPPFSFQRTWKVPPSGAGVHFSFGIMGQARVKPGDGVYFRVIAQTKGEDPREAFSRYINPKADLTERRWFSGTVDLAHFAGKEVTLTFQTKGSGPATYSLGGTEDNDYDFSVWAE